LRQVGPPGQAVSVVGSNAGGRLIRWPGSETESGFNYGVSRWSCLHWQYRMVNRRSRIAGHPRLLHASWL